MASLLGSCRHATAIAALSAVLLACDAAAIDPPRMLALEPGPRSTPLGALLRLELGQSGTLHVHVDATDDDDSASFELTRPVEALTVLELPLLGLRFDRHYAITLALCLSPDECGPLGEPLALNTPPRPEHLPPIRVLHAEPERMEPGWTLLVLLPSGEMLLPSPWSALLALDAEGEIVWYHEVNGWIGDHALGADRVSYTVSNLRLEEVDFLGNVLGRWHAAKLGSAGAHPEAVLVDAETMHHELVALGGEDDAAFLVLDTERRSFDAYPSDEVTLAPSEAPTEVAGDVVLELNRQGAVIRRASLLDVLDPWRLGYDSLLDFWAPVYGPGTRDWAHANAVTLTPERDAYLVSLRHQDAIVKLDRESGGLQWIFGDPARWQAPWSEQLLDVAWASDATLGEYSYHHHAPAFAVDGSVILFDNGVERAVPPAEPMPEGERYSRAVQYVIDEDQGYVEQVWAWHGPEDEGMYSRIVGDADPLPMTGNVLVVSGARADSERMTSWARLFEVTHDASAECVFDLQVGEREAEPGTQWVVYRAERMAALR